MLISTYRAETSLTLAHLDFDLYLQKDPGKVNEFYNNVHMAVLQQLHSFIKECLIFAG